MKPNPMFMLLREMRQSQHGPGYYQGNLSGQEKIVFSEEEAEDWAEAELQPGQKVTLIEITEIRTYTKDESGRLSIGDPADEITLTKEEAYKKDYKPIAEA